MIPIKLVVCDIDNTLVVKHTSLSDRSREAIRELRRRGVLFGLASGRGCAQLRDLSEQWGIESDLLIGINGAEIYDGLTGENELIYQMEPAWIREALEIMAPFDCNPGLFRNGITYVRRIDERIAASAAYTKKTNPTQVVEDESEFWAGPAPKIWFRVKAEDMPAIETRAAQFPRKGYISFKTENNMYECGNAEASKGKLLKLFCDRHGIDMAQVWSFGDMTNDISMLEMAGVGVCMANGSDDAKTAAQIVTEKGVEEDGWADFVEKHILSE